MSDELLKMLIEGIDLLIRTQYAPTDDAHAKAHWAKLTADVATWQKKMAKIAETDAPDVQTRIQSGLEPT